MNTDTSAPLDPRGRQSIEIRRELVSSGEVTDVLLDVRSLLTLPAPAAAVAASADH